MQSGPRAPEKQNGSQVPIGSSNETEEIGCVFFWKDKDRIIRYRITNDIQFQAYIKLAMIASYNQRAYARWGGLLFLCSRSDIRGGYKKQGVDDTFWYVP